MKAKKLLRNLFYVKVWMEVETTKQISFSLGEKHQPLSLSVCTDLGQPWSSNMDIKGSKMGLRYSLLIVGGGGASPKYEISGGSVCPYEHCLYFCPVSALPFCNLPFTSHEPEAIVTQSGAQSRFPDPVCNCTSPQGTAAH